MSGAKIIEGLKSAIAYADGTADKSTYVAHTLEPAQAPASVDVKAIRQGMGLSQSMFAATFGLSLHTLRNWEQGKRQPDPAVRSYLRVIEVAPDVVRQALHG